MPLHLHLDTYLCLVSHLPRPILPSFGLKCPSSLSRQLRPLSSVNKATTSSHDLDNDITIDQEVSTASTSFLPDLIPPDLPPLPPKPPDPPTRVYPPIRPHTISPAERSRVLSELHKLSAASSYPDQDKSDDVYADFVRLHFSSPDSHVYTVAELTSMLYHLLNLRKRYRHHSRKYAERIRIVADELKEVIGPDQYARQAIEAKILPITSASRRKLSSSQLETLAQQFESLYKDPLQIKGKGLEMYRIRLNHLIYQSAKIGDEKSFEKWWSRYLSRWTTPDSYAIMAKLRLYIEIGRLTPATFLLDNTLKRVAEETEETEEPVGKDGAMKLVNFALWQLAKKGQWRTVSSIYGRLHPAASSPFMTIIQAAVKLEEELASASHFFDSVHPSNEMQDFQIPASLDLTPDRTTYSSLIKALCHQQHLVPALQILQHMLQVGHLPGIPEYMSFFIGFSKYGHVPSIPAGELISSFPRWVDGHDNSSTNATTRIDRLSEIWERGSGITSPPQMDTPESEWKFELLQDLLETFLQLVPRQDENRSPTAKGIFQILLATARTSHGDFVAVYEVWTRLNRKFGVGNTEGWIGWSEDTRIKRLRGLLEAEVDVE